MAILGKIRQRSLILILVIAMALFSFVLADLFKGGGFDAEAQNTVATINGIDLSREDFMQKVENYQQQLGGRGTATQAMNAIWEQELRSAILQAQYDELGITVERDQMRDLLKQGLTSYEEFKDEAGVFDENKLNEFIANLKEIAPNPSFLGNTPINYEAWKNYESDLARGGQYQTYFNMVKSGLVGTSADGKLEHKLENDKVDIKYIQIPYISIQDSTITVSKNDISDYINRNQKQFEVEESRDIYFVQFNEEPSLEDEEAIKNNILSLMDDRVEYNEASKLNDTVEGFTTTTDFEGFLSTYSATNYFDQYLVKSQLPQEYADSLIAMNVGDFSKPYKASGLYNISKIVDAKQVADSVKSSHIIVPYAGAFQVSADITRTREEAQKIADSLLPLVKNNVSKFSEVANEINTDGSKGNDGEVGWTRLATFNPQAFDPDYANFIFYNDKGSVDVVETKFGFHIIRIDDALNFERAIKIANLGQAIEASEATINEVFNKTSKFEIAVQDKVFQDVATENNYDVKQATDFKELDETIPGIGSQRQIVRWAFEEEAKIGDVRRFSLPNGFVVAVLSNKTKAGLMSVEKASVTVLPQVRKELKAKMIREGVSGNTLDEIAATQNQSVKTAVAVNMKNPTLSGAGREPKVIGAAFGLQEGETSNLIDGNNGVYMVQVTKVTPATELANYNGPKEALVLSKVTAANTALYNALKEKAEIKDNRATMY